MDWYQHGNNSMSWATDYAYCAAYLAINGDDELASFNYACKIGIVFW